MKAKKVNKTPLMLKVERKVGEPLEDFLKREYVEAGKPVYRVAKFVDVSYGAIRKWLDVYGIPIRDNGIVKPSKKQLEQLYIKKRMSTTQIAELFNVSKSTVPNWLKSYKIAIRAASEAHLLNGIVKPSKKQLEQLYIKKRMSTVQLAERFGVTDPTVGNWLRSYELHVRTVSESQLPDGLVKPSKKQLEQLYVKEGMTQKQIARKLGLTQTMVSKMLRDTGVINVINSKQFTTLLEEDPALLNLSAVAVSSNGQGYDVEKIITEMYEGKFKDQEQLHQLLQENAERIRELINRGVTNLGAYIGEFTFGDRRIIPVLIGEALTNMPEGRVTPSLEERLARILRLTYSPRFNENPQETLTEIKAKIDSSQGKVKSLYERLQNHYQGIIELGEELR